MPLRPVAIVAGFNALLAVVSGANAGAASDLDAAFQATFGQPAPIMRHVERPLHYVDQPDKFAGYEPLEMELTPDQLVRIDGSRWALIIKETSENHGHIVQGAIAVSFFTIRAAAGR